MTTISTGRGSGSLPGRQLATLLLAATLGLLFAGPALADRNDHQKRDRQRIEQSRKHDQREWREQHRDDRGQYGNYRTYRQPQPVYLPPPVYYAPPQSPGISLFFPLDLRR